jgi:spore coat polysaccharide biosynthesis predicted glycosyltransferase SpsG
VLDALTRCELITDLRITVVMGPISPWLAQVQTQAAVMPCQTQVLAGVSNMAQLMAESDLCIGAAGGSAWERCALGLPSLVFILAANQHIGAMALQSHGAAWVAADEQQLLAQMSALLNKNTQTATLRKMSHSAAKLANGNGISQVVESLLKLYV